MNQKFNRSIKDYELEEIKKRAEKNRRQKVPYEMRDEVNNENFISKMAMYVSLGFALVSSVTFFLLILFQSSDLVDFGGLCFSSALLAIFAILFVLISLFADHKKGRYFVIIASVLLGSYSTYQTLHQLEIVQFPQRAVVENFYGKKISDVIAWANENDILVEQVFEYSDSLEQYFVLSQDTAPGTIAKKVDKIVITVSDGPNPEKKTNIPNMIGWNVEQVLEFAEEHFLTSVTIDFEINDRIERDTIYEQNISSVALKRNEELKLIASLGKKAELISTAMEDLVGKDLFEATLFLKRNAISYTIQYAYSDSKEEGTILKQSVAKGVKVEPFADEKVILTVAKQSQITVPNLKKMTASEITTWAIENKLKVSFSEENDDSIGKGKFVRATIAEGALIEPGTSFQVVLSKGQLKMIRFTTVDSFVSWAKENDVSYQIDYQFSESIDSGKIISASHEEGDVIKNTDAVSLIISQGGKTTVPNLIGKTKDEAERICNDSRVKCSFESVPSDKEKDTVVEQSMRSGSKVPLHTSITVSISAGK